MKQYIPSLRLRTLPLSVAGIILGTGLAWPDIRWGVATLAVLTTLCLQILANLSNELGDAQRGTDAEQANRPQYGLQRGTVTPKGMRRLIGAFIVLAALSGLALVGVSFGSLLDPRALMMLGVGALAIVGAMAYTLGSHPYGYHGLGDLGVFIFFGLVSVVGAYYMQTHSATLRVALAAVAISGPIIGVLNLNNIRDMRGDIEHSKHTLASRLGPRGARVYQTALLAASVALFAALGRWWTLVAIPPLAWHVAYLWRHDGAALDRLLPPLSLTTLAMAALACL